MLKARFTKNLHTNKDTLRDILLRCLTQNYQIGPSDIFLKFSHSVLTGSYIDLYINPQKEHPSFVFEFRYEQKPPINKQPSKPKNPFQIDPQIFKLAPFKGGFETPRYLIYVNKTYTHDKPTIPEDNLPNPVTERQLRTDNLQIKNHAFLFRNFFGRKITPWKLVCYSTENTPKFSSRIYEVTPTDPNHQDIWIRNFCRNVPENQVKQENYYDFLLSLKYGI